MSFPECTTIKRNPQASRTYDLLMEMLLRYIIKKFYVKEYIYNTYKNI